MCQHLLDQTIQDVLTLRIQTHLYLWKECNYRSLRRQKIVITIISAICRQIRCEPDSFWSGNDPHADCQCAWQNLTIAQGSFTWPSFTWIDDYAKDGGPEVVWHLCSFYQDPLRSKLSCLVSYTAKIHRTTSNGFTESLLSIWNQSDIKSQSYWTCFTIKERKGSR